MQLHAHAPEIHSCSAAHGPAIMKATRASDLRSGAGGMWSEASPATAARPEEQSSGIAQRARTAPHAPSDFHPGFARGSLEEPRRAQFDERINKRLLVTQTPTVPRCPALIMQDTEDQAYARRVSLDARAERYRANRITRERTPAEQRVRISGLTDRPELNGLCGVAGPADPSSGRRRVVSEIGSTEPTPTNIQASSLMPAVCAAAEAQPNPDGMVAAAS